VRREFQVLQRTSVTSLLPIWSGWAYFRLEGQNTRRAVSIVDLHDSMDDRRPAAQYVRRWLQKFKDSKTDYFKLGNAKFQNIVEAAQRDPYLDFIIHAALTHSAIEHGSDVLFSLIAAASNDRVLKILKDRRAFHAALHLYDRNCYALERFKCNLWDKPSVECLKCLGPSLRSGSLASITFKLNWDPTTKRKAAVRIAEILRPLRKKKLITKGRGKHGSYFPSKALICGVEKGLRCYFALLDEVFRFISPKELKQLLEAFALLCNAGLRLSKQESPERSDAYFFAEPQKKYLAKRIARLWPKVGCRTLRAMNGLFKNSRYVQALHSELQVVRPFVSRQEVVVLSFLRLGAVDLLPPPDRSSSGPLSLDWPGISQTLGSICKRVYYLRSQLSPLECGDVGSNILTLTRLAPALSKLIPNKRCEPLG